MAIVKRIASEEYANEKALYEANEAVKNILQSDWNQNDETAVDFIKNKPFYEAEVEVSNVIYEGQVELIFNPMVNGLEGTLEEENSCKMGKTYKVIFNRENNELVSQEVVCECTGSLMFDIPDYPGLYGEIYLNNILFEPLPDYPLEVKYPEDGIYSLKIEDTESKGNVTTIKTLDEKFIPDTIARTNQIPSSDDFVTSINGQTGDVTIEIPDWNQNNGTARDFIKNRTHYEDTVTTSIVLVDEEVYFDIIPDYGQVGGFSEPIALENGKTYTVTINGVKQEIVCENDELIFNSPEFDNEITIKSSSGILGYNGDDTCNIKIETTTLSTVVKQLDEKFIPDTIARVEDSWVIKSSTEGSTKKFKLTIDDDGVLTATEIVESTT